MDKKTSDRFTSAVSANLAVLEKLQGLWMARAIHVDVGGGQGDFLRRLLTLNATVRGVLSIGNLSSILLKLPATHCMAIEYP